MAMTMQYHGGSMLGQRLHNSINNTENSREYIKSIYDAMGSNDMSDVVFTTLSILRKTENVPEEQINIKTNEESNNLRSIGNQKFEKKCYKEALFLYNEALLTAPKNSTALKLAYSNRSAVLHKLEKYQECINDIDRCLSLGCPDYIKGKLMTRKEDATRLLNQQNKTKSEVQNYFQLDSVHSQIPCASRHLRVIQEGNKPKIVAETDIRVGTVLAIEKPYVSHSEKTYFRACCHYCNKFSLNLLPCEDCCYAYFCSDKCRDLCNKEYHNIECMLIELIKFKLGLFEALMFKAVLKLMSSETWDKLIKISQALNIEVDKSQKNLGNDILDINNMLSIFNSKDERTFIFGDIYNESFVCAVLLHHLEIIPNVFPCIGKEKAMRAIARIMMYMIIYRKPHVVIPAGNNIIKNEASLINKFRSYGIYPFINIIGESCQANVMTVSINNSLALIATKPIKSGKDIIKPCGLATGMELVKQDHSIEQIQKFSLFTLQRDVCCCKKSFENVNPQNISLTKIQKKIIKGLNLDMHSMSGCKTDGRTFRKICEALAALSDVPNSKEFCQVARLFRQSIVMYQAIESRNFFLDDNRIQIYAF